MKARIGQNPEFATITGLTNRNFDAGNITEGQMVTEEQLREVYERIVADEMKADACCKDIIFWEARTQVVQLNDNTISAAGIPQAGGTVLSTFDDNVNFGTARRGLAHTATFPLKWDDDLYFPITPETNITSGSSSCNALTAGNTTSTTQYISENFASIVQYRYLLDAVLNVNICDATTTNRSGFFVGAQNANSTIYEKRARQYAYQNEGLNARVGDVWGAFIFEIKDDGTVSIKNNIRANNYNIIRYYTQWTLNRCKDGSLLSDNTWPIQPRH